MFSSVRLTRLAVGQNYLYIQRQPTRSQNVGGALQFMPDMPFYFACIVDITGLYWTMRFCGSGEVADMDLQRDIWEYSASQFITFLFIPGGRDDESVAIGFCSTVTDTTQQLC